MPSNIPDGRWNLQQNQTNGHSFLGSFDAPTYGMFMGAGNGASKSFPWGAKTAQNTNPYQNAPDTGVVRQYDFTIARATLAPDGVERSVILINGEFPGPTIEADWGDTIQVTVHNDIDSPSEGTTLHWHGLLQTDTNYEDGVPGITQCPIAPGQTFTYSFKADLYGTSWYHAHYSAQYASGLFGAMIIHGPADNAQYDIDLGPVLLTDYYHTDYYDIVEQVMGTDQSKIAPHSDNNLINGKGIMNCTEVNDGLPCTTLAGLSKFQFQTGKTHRLRLINAGAEGTQKFSIDNHALTVMAYDFVPIVPFETTVVTLGVGQRADVLVTADGGDDDIVWMRSTLSSCSLANQPNGLAMIYYPSADPNAKPTTSPWPDTTDPCANDDLSTTVPYYSITPPSQPDVTVEIDIASAINATGHFVWTMNNSTFRTDYNAPILAQAQAGQPSSSFPAEWNVFDFGEARSIRLVVNNLSPITHPMHVHGHNMYVLSVAGSSPTSTGLVAWDGSIVNAQNPTRRDTQLLPPNGHLVMQIDADNPGVWPFHCHIAWHVSSGLYVNLLERPNDIPSTVQSPSAVSDLCSSWSAFTSQDIVDQIDSGL